MLSTSQPTSESPFTAEVYNEWEHIAWMTHGSESRIVPKAQKEGWQALFSKSFVDGQWRTRNTDAALVASLGMSIAFAEYEFEEVLRLADLYFSHPDVASAPNFATQIHYWRAAASIALDQPTQAVADCHRLLEIIPYPSMALKCIILGLVEQGERPVSQLLSGFTQELMRKLGLSRRRVRHAAVAKTSAQLSRACDRALARRTRLNSRPSPAL